MAKEISKPNGPVSAALLAGGIGSAVLGILTFADEVFPALAKPLAWYKPTGDLTGKSTLAILAFFVSWVVLHFVWKDKETNFSQVSTIAIALLLLSLILTFPPVWGLFGG